MADKMKQVFMCRLSDRWLSITCLSEMVRYLKTLKNIMFICFYGEKRSIKLCGWMDDVTCSSANAVQ